MRFVNVLRFVFLLSAGVLPAAVLLAELYARIVDLPPVMINLSVGEKKSAFKLSDNRILGYEMKPGYRDLKNPDLHESFPYVNSIGFRDIERQTGKSSFRILMLGDSVLAGHGIRAIDDLISRELESDLESRGYDLEVLNFGVGGYATSAEIELLRTNGIRFDPDLVIILFIQNDFELFGNQLSKYGSQDSSPVLEFFLTNMRLFRHFAFRYDLFDVAYIFDPNYRIIAGKSMGRRTLMKDHLSKFQALSEECGFGSIIVYWPKFPAEERAAALESSPWRENFDQLSPITDSLGIELVDLAPLFEEDYRRSGAQASPAEVYTNGDGMHPVEFGTETGAAILAQILEEGGYLPRR